MRKIIFLVCFVSLPFYSQGQSKSNFDSLNEKLFVHLNTTFLLSGEKLYYSVYCLNKDTNKLSTLSKIAYVELISDDKKVIFKQKIRLHEGLGNSDFFIPASVSSGNYKLIAYTKLMLNKSHFFENDLAIVNPFHQNQSNIIDTLETKSNVSIKDRLSQIDNKTNSRISLALTSNNFSTRQKVSFAIGALFNEDSYGNYSISIKNITDLNIPKKATSKTFSDRLDANKADITLSRNDFIIPELRGELISGKILKTDSNEPVPDMKVAISIPGKSSVFKISSTNKDGVFYFNLNEAYENTTANIQILDAEKVNYSIIMEDQSFIDYQKLNFGKFSISKKNKELILKQSVHNQIENAFESAKKDSILTENEIISFYGSYGETYYLDDYKRFPTMSETFVEVIEDAWISSKKGENTFRVKRAKNTSQSDLLPLLLVDGIFVQDHNEIASYDAKKINKISILRDKYIYGPEVFEGIISIETLKGDYKNLVSNGYMKNVDLFKPVSRKKYFSQDYSNGKNYTRIPDFRSQLFWNPHFVLNDKEAVVSFYSSDNTGVYEINIEGFTNDGKSVSVRKYFEVK